MYTDYEILSMSHEIKRKMEHACEQLMETSGLRKVELDVLYFIAHAGKKDTAKDIINAQHVSKAHISKSVDNLRQGGYILLVEDEEDHRRMHIQITDRGIPIVIEFERLHHMVMAQLFSGVTEEEKSCMKRVVQKIIANVGIEAAGSLDGNREKGDS